jgi:Protein of unknown function (DUF5672)
LKSVVVILIFAHKASLEWYEEIALKQCFRILGRHPIRMICPRGLNVEAYRAIVPQLEVDFIPPHWQSSRLNYNRLKSLPFLYRRYRQYDYMLTYELDAFVFRNELLDWCAKGWDYIGAPWFEGHDSAKPDAPFLGVGNSGFSLRRIQAMIDVFSTWRNIQPTMEIVREVRSSNLSRVRKLAAVTKRLIFNNFHPPFTPANSDESRPHKIHDDNFWCEVPKRLPDFKVADLEQAKQFSFEVNPSRLYADIGGRLPFGCHKWMEYEPGFWKEFIEQYGYNFPAADLANDDT